MPPQQYDVPPPLPVIEHVLSYAEVQRHCRRYANASADTRWIGGCARFILEGSRKVKCEVWVSGPSSVGYVPELKTEGFITKDVTADIRRHERAHCAGWPADHPGATVVERHRHDK